MDFFFCAFYDSDFVVFNNSQNKRNEFELTKGGEIEREREIKRTKCYGNMMEWFGLSTQHNSHLKRRKQQNKHFRKLNGT